MFGFFKRKQNTLPTFAPLVTDMHCHLLPLVDDGSKSLEESLEVMEAMKAVGYQQIKLTPHFSYPRFPNVEEQIMERYAHFCDEVEANKDLIEKATIFHYGTLSMTDDVVEAASVKALQIAKEAGCILSFDPNLRPPLWSSEEKAKEKISYGLGLCDVLKISDNEIEFMTGKTDLEEGVYDLIRLYHIPLILATYGKDGSKAYYLPKEKRGKDAGPEDYIKVFVPGFVNPDTIETTGAGDCFGGCSLHYVLKYGLDNFDEDKLKELLTFANGAASIVTTRKGALCVMPEEKEVLDFIG